jgi:hypothetical protein
MITKTEYFVPIIDKCKLHEINFQSTNRIVLNEPTGNFFYDSWKIKSEFKNTFWEEVLNFLPKNIGEARIMLLKSGSCYYKHADIDDRYHLNLSGDSSFLVDLEKNIMHDLTHDGYWYNMDAGILHSAISFGEQDRIQIVVRQLLTRNHLTNPKKVIIKLNGVFSRYRFDNLISPWLNRANKKYLITDFQYNEKESYVSFLTEEVCIEEIEKLISNEEQLILTCETI